MTDAATPHDRTPDTPSGDHGPAADDDAPERYAPDLLADRHVLVTGGATGLGFAMARCFARLGARLTLCGRRRGRLDEAVARLADEGLAAVGLPCDVRDEDAVERCVATAEERQGPLTTLVNNAAGNFLAFSERLTPRALDAVIRTNLYGGLAMTRACGRRWIERQGGGVVLSITTTYADSGSAYVLPSAVSKAGLNAMTRSLAVEWGPLGIRLNAIAPGPIPTPGAWSRLIPDGDTEEALRRQQPQRRFVTRRELTDLAAFLVSDLSSAVNGEVIALDGGQHLMAGLFNRMTLEPREALAATFEAMRPPPRGAGGA